MTADTLERRLTSLERAVAELGTRLTEVERRVSPATGDATRPDEQARAELAADVPRSTPTEMSIPEATPRVRVMPPPLPGAGDTAGAERGSRWASVVAGRGEQRTPVERSVEAAPLGTGAESPRAADRVDGAAPTAQTPVATIGEGTTPSALAYETAAPAASAPVARREAGAWERSLGGKWAAWLGALVMVVGAGLGLKFAYDQGWLGGLPAGARLALWAAASLAVVGAGEVVLRRIGRAASAGVFAAGLGSLFAVAYSGHAYFGLYSPAMALTLTILATLLGAGVAARARLLSIGVLTLLGGHLAPVVIGGNAASLTPFLAYLTALQVVGLLMAGLGEGKWWALRWLSLAAAGLWTVKVADAAGGVPVELMAFALATAGLAVAELTVSALRGTLVARDATPAEAPHHPPPGDVETARSRPTWGGVRVRGGATGESRNGTEPPAGVGQLEAYTTLAGLLAAGVAYAHTPFGTPGFLLAALVTAAGLAVVARTLARSATRRGGDAALLRLDAVLRAEAFGVVALGLFHGLPAPWHLVGAAAVGLALGAFTRLRPASPGRHFAGIAAVLLPAGAAARYAAGAWGLAELPAGLWGIGPAAVGLACAAGAWVSLLLAARREDDLAPPAVVSLLPTLAFVPLAFAVSTPAVGVAITLALAWAWAGAGRVWGAGRTVPQASGRDLPEQAAEGVAAPDAGAASGLTRYLPGGQALGVLTVAGVLWGLFVAIGPRLAADYTGAAERLLLNPTALTALLLAASVVLLPRLVRGGRTSDAGDRPSTPALGAAAVALVVVLIAGLLETDRAVLKAAGTLGLAWGLEPMLARAAVSVAWFSSCVAAWAVIARRRIGTLHVSSSLAVLGAAATGLTALASLGVRVTPVGNAVVLLGLASMATVALYAWLLRHRPGAGAPAATLAGGMLVLTGGAVEIVRYAAQQTPAPVAGFPAGWAAVLLLTPWAVAVGVAGLWAARRWARELPMYPVLATAATALLLATALKSGLLDALLPWVAGLARSGTPLANLQLGASAAALAALFAAWWLRTNDGRGLSPGMTRLGAVIAGLVAFLASSAESARCLTALGRTLGVTDVRLLVMAGYSVWWALLALAAVIAGFRWRLSGLRYAGLALFGLTLLKVVTLDLSGAGQGWRVLSFIGLGAVLLATSVLYAKLAPLLLPKQGQTPR